MTEAEKENTTVTGTSLPEADLSEQGVITAPAAVASATKIAAGTEKVAATEQAATTEKVNGDQAATESGEKVPDSGIGYIEVAEEVISIVASLAACDVTGVAGMSTGFREGISKFFGKSNLAKGVRIKMEGKTVNVFVYVIVEYGTNIPEVALKIQKKVKDAVESMTEYEVNYVDVHVEGVERRKKSVLEQSLEEETEQKKNNAVL